MNDKSLEQIAVWYQETIRVYDNESGYFIIEQESDNGEDTIYVAYANAEALIAALRGVMGQRG